MAGIALAVAALQVITAAPAHAGVYTVTSCDASGRIDGWVSEKNVGYGDSWLTSCAEGMIARSVARGDKTLAPVGSLGRWVFRAPTGTRLVAFAGDYRGWAMWPWWTGFKNPDTDAWEFCMDFCNSTLTQWAHVQFGNLSQGGIALETECYIGPSGCRRDADNFGISYLRNVTLWLSDDWLPGVSITGGSLLSAGWHSGTQTLDYTASDNTGIRTVRTLVDGAVKGRDDRPCDGYSPIPCANAGGSLPLDTRAVFGTDGQHTITIEVTDGGYNVSSASRTVYVDNTPPGQPQGLAVSGAGQWTSTNHFAASWAAGTSQGAPIVASDYQLCPVGGPPQSCVRGRSAGAASSLPDLKLPSDGAWRLSVWQEDAAGNQDPNRSAVVSPLELDTTAPDVSLRAPDASDPARFRVAATDAASGVAAIAVEIQRKGTDAWVPLRVDGDPTNATALVDDERLARGNYAVRARVTDRAGNERSTTTFADSTPATIALPARVVTTLRSGRLYRRGHHLHIARTLRARLGRHVATTGRLMLPGGNPLPDAPIDVYARVSLAGQRWKRIGAAKTGRHGWFRYRAPAGPDRVLEFRYPGTATLRGATRYVRVHVPAATTIRSTPQHTVNGGYVRFHGRIRGSWLPRSGKLVQLQVYTRRQWRTFAQPRASWRKGRWHYDYRFETVSGRATFRFRALVPREAGYPFETGRSRTTRVWVTGL